ncbi:hypothetical protein BJ508DRAFT_410394 [Ascobolus immersus RN42]|uniref:Endonuclease n=1 Tax=Ascobolus immersus RN42 TaxID=1160509 RepID=A0A3N4IPF1_ASCIM|nr:hypothetical protein BJ508DRAFT_410394 [Ascobolus immersus RN42]
MSKVTLIAAAAVGAITGAATTALFVGGKKQTAATTVPATLPQNSVSSSAPNQHSAAVPPSVINSLQQDLKTPINPAGLFEYGFPGPINDLANRKALVSAYDRRTRNPMWVAEHITAESLKVKGGDRKNSVFVEDPEIPAKFQAKLKDYFRSGYDRGHQVPAADAKWSQQAMDDTFFLSNMCPQVGEGFNRDYWSHFEDFCRRLTHKYPSVRIVTGPLYLPRQYPDGKWRVSYEVIGSPANVAVPTHFYKVIFAEGPNPKSDPVAIGAFVLPNARIDNKTKLTDFEVPLEAVERASGLEFATLLPNHRKKELCKQIECSITVREFNNARKELPAPKQ